MENAEIAEIAEDAPAEGPAPVPAPAPAATLEIVHEQPHSKSKKKSTENFGRPASAYSDFLHTDTISTWLSGYPVQCIDLYKHL